MKTTNKVIDPISVVISCETPACRIKAEALSQQLSHMPGIILVENHPITDNLIYNLHITEQKLELRGGLEKNMHPLSIDFLAGKMHYRLSQGSKNKEQIAKAVGLKGQIKPKVWDTTAGLGRDAYILASLGCQVQLIERSPILFLLLQDGLIRASNDPIAAPIVARMHLTLGDACTILENIDNPESVSPPLDVIYLDPMYPCRSKSALTKKEMRILREVVGDDNDAEALLSRALSKARYRVVVKRPKTAEPLAGPCPHFKIAGGNNRFDVYLTHLSSMDTKT
jgi:16S rRNA (guanine1516-N2)-methyltransferase